MQISKIDKLNPYGRTIALILNDIENQAKNDTKIILTLASVDPQL